MAFPPISPEAIGKAFADGRAYKHTVHDCTIHELRERVNARFGKAPKVDLRITDRPTYRDGLTTGLITGVWIGCLVTVAFAFARAFAHSQGWVA